MSLPDDELGPLYLAAEAALHRGDVEAARRDFERLLLDAPRFAPAWDGLGNCHAAEGDLERAGECYRKAIRLDRRNWRSRYNWGAALHRAGELEEACRWLRAAAGIRPDERRIHQRLGVCHFDRGDYEGALRYYRRALEQPERDVSDAELYVNIGNAESERGDVAAAEDAYQRACLLSPDDPMIYYNWAVVLQRAGELDEAERLAVRARALDPRSPRATILLVRLAVERADFAAAESWIARLAEFPGTERLAHALRAEAARLSGDDGRARFLALEALRMEGTPSDHAVDSALATLRRLRGTHVSCRGYRLVVEVSCGEQSYFRPFVVLAEDEEQARWYVAELQDALDSNPWEVTEIETFAHDGEVLAGVYSVLLTRVLFQKEQELSPTER